MVKETKGRILIVGFCELVDAVNDARQDGKRVKFAAFDVASGAWVEKTIGALGVSCRSKAYSRFCS